ncbi:TlpA family protein disulfide reductase [Litoribacter ruber]|uniref:TlpA family protein disulfide reductase n=1 Tax=Litoribacter ruber TaxID=702568 RepID=UPI001BD997FB|nr:TlpA disulfide reductase family protein [Litoribacter ruber]MBT0811190.1 TlpA family protein disulfide reductase [Litoribacter ruber]
MDWKKEIKSWGIILIVFAALYFTGLITPIVGGLQSMMLSTGLIKPKVLLENKENEPFDFSGRLTDMEGNVVNLQDFEGKTIFINLWATWCPPCRAEMPHIAELYKKVSHREDIEFLMIALDDDFQKSKNLIEKKTWSFPVYHASHGLNGALQSQSIPTTLVVSPAGEIVFYQEGMSNFNTREFEEFLLGL